MVTRQGHILYQDPEGVLMEGWLSKRGLVSKALKRRYFRLVARPTQLWYYSKENVKAPRGGITIGNPKTKSHAAVRWNENKLIISTKRRVYHLTANTSQQAAEWKTKIQDAVETEAEEWKASELKMKKWKVALARTTNSGSPGEGSMPVSPMPVTVGSLPASPMPDVAVGSIPLSPKAATQSPMPASDPSQHMVVPVTASMQGGSVAEKKA
mmetsp:Transcript_7213/g.10061  ORF Transcript_7213/g.10061 Transcript_7213/m.10061 type:complete len:211 (-) Transcript_7213:657-1289(-)|eukprot:CAMPEP_0184488108 /NCGR_PEP_ID=MMETSP0113_2-20130426/10530_1 /TAXON_ID=91329 /ORGANISM="Norrisiella sphaerica, Strain BC52" /LENGTH=210 /DNA_ID=CAMNT_0026870585 /DNA_START=271 /DNA_END=903 /DNA_ORIENTATION=+